MAYHVEYEMQNIKITKRDYRKEAAAVAMFTAMLVVIALISHFCGSAFQGFLSEKGEITNHAANQLAEDLHSGVPLRDAVEAFYIEITQ